MDYEYTTHGADTKPDPINPGSSNDYSARVTERGSRGVRTLCVCRVEDAPRIVEAMRLFAVREAR